MTSMPSLEAVGQNLKDVESIGLVLDAMSAVLRAYRDQVPPVDGRHPIHQVIWNRATSVVAELARSNMTEDERHVAIQEVKRITGSTQDKLLADCKDPEPGLAELLLRNHNNKIARIKHQCGSKQDRARTLMTPHGALPSEAAVASSSTGKASTPAVAVEGSSSTLYSLEPASLPPSPFEPFNGDDSSSQGAGLPILLTAASTSLDASVTAGQGSTLPSAAFREAEVVKSNGEPAEVQSTRYSPTETTTAGAASMEVNGAKSMDIPPASGVTENGVGSTSSMMPKPRAVTSAVVEKKAAFEDALPIPRRRRSPLPGWADDYQLPRYVKPPSVKQPSKPSTASGVPSAPISLDVSHSQLTGGHAASAGITDTTTKPTTTSSSISSSISLNGSPARMPSVPSVVSVGGGGLKRQGQEESKEEGSRDNMGQSRATAGSGVVKEKPEDEAQLPSSSTSSSSCPATGASSLPLDGGSDLTPLAKKPKLSHTMMVQENKSVEHLSAPHAATPPQAAIAPALPAQTLEHKKDEIEKNLKSTPLRSRKREHDLPLFLKHVEEGDEEAVEMWANRNYVVLKEGFIKAIVAGNANIVKTLLQKCGGTDYCLMKMDEKKFTLLHLAVIHGHSGLVETLAEHMKTTFKMERNSTCKSLSMFKDRTGKTAMHYAVEYNQAACVNALVRAGHPLTDRDSGHFPPVLYVRPEGIDVAKALIAQGVDLDSEDNEHRTLLYWATHYQGQREYGWGNVVSLLRQHCAGYGKRMLKDCQHDISLGNERFWIPVRVESTSSSSAAHATATAMDVEDTATGPDDIIHRRRRAEAKLPYPVFAYVNESLNNPPLPANQRKSCKCRGDCLSELVCSCSKNNLMGRCPYSMQGHLQDLTIASYINECGPGCKCDPETCGLRQTSRGLAVRVEVVRNEAKGWCVHTVDRLRRGQFVACYLGEYLQPAEAAARFDRITRSGGNANYQLEVGHVVIDANYIGNIARLFNHSCEPNLIMKKVKNGRTYPAVAFYCARDVQAGEKLTFNYETDKKKAHKDAIGATSCHCGKPKCRKVPEESM